MSVTTAAFGSQQAATPEFPRHVVTAVLVSHDGARWLPDALAGLLGQERPVQNVIAADTGSADDSARLLTEALGAERVLHLARRTGFGTAVDEAARTAGVLTPDDLPVPEAAQRLGPGQPHLARRRVRHARAAPRRTRPVAVAAARRLRARPRRPRRTAARRRRRPSTPPIVGPKLRGWYDRKQLLEAGVSIANSGRRWTGLDRREQDQGQHDQVRPVLSVSSAGMLIRRDVFEQLGGFDRRLPLMRDDVDLCWRAHAAGHRVLIAPDAVLRHAEAAARERRTVDCAGRSVASPHRVDKAGAVYTLLANARGAAAALRPAARRPRHPAAHPRLPRRQGARPGRRRGHRTLRHPAAARADHRRAPQTRGKRAVEAERTAPALPAARRDRPRHRRTGRRQLRRPVRRRRPAARPARRRRIRTRRRRRRLPGDRAVRAAEADRPQARPGALRRPARSSRSSPAAACSAAASLAGGALLPAPADVSDLWARYADSWHPVGTGGTQTAPPYLAVLAALVHPLPRLHRLRAHRCCSSARSRSPDSPRTSPPARSSNPGCCGPGRASRTPSCPPRPARSPAAASAPPSSRSCCR